MPSVLILADMNTWWNGLPGPAQVYFLISIVAGIIALFLTIGGLIGLDAVDDPSDFSVGHTDAEAFSIRAINGFFLGFGLVGYACEVSGFSHLSSALAGLATGIAMMAIIVFTMRTFKKLRSDGTMRMQDTVGATGTVYVTVPPHGAVGGQVNITFGNRNETFLAIQHGPKALAGGSRIRVVEFANDTVTIEAI